MGRCPRCEAEAGFDDAFCRRCGTALRGPAGAPAGPGAAPSPAGPPSGARPRLRIALLVSLGLAAGSLIFALVGNRGCSRVQGTVTAAGQPLGEFAFTPATCRSGQRAQFHGVVLLGRGPTEGGLIVGEDPATGRYLKVEVPGSCQPPSYEACREVLVRPDACSRFDVRIEASGIQVNDVRLMEGHARFDCAFPEGGTLRGDLAFERCD